MLFVVTASRRVAHGSLAPAAASLCLTGVGVGRTCGPANHPSVHLMVIAVNVEEKKTPRGAYLFAYAAATELEEGDAVGEGGGGSERP